MGYGVGTQSTFAFLLVQQMGGTEVLMGMMLLFSILTEAPAFQFQAALLARVPVALVMNASTLLMAVRMGLYALLPLAPTPWAVLPIELLHGVTFATSWGAGIVNCKRIAPPSLNTSMQSMFSAVFVGVGPGLGGIFGGMLMQSYGVRATFAATSAVIAGGWAAALATDALITACERRAEAAEAAAEAAGLTVPAKRGRSFITPRSALSMIFAFPTPPFLARTSRRGVSRAATPAA
ncbi:MAG: hypothetical protein J3K34DRAFT_430162 [Monoraphidium minutum]|nr:MAG: hypothetical protein J3K34DRAFT_430162 [Monoraphidium minutum]